MPVIENAATTSGSAKLKRRHTDKAMIIKFLCTPAPFA
jgi:hypothetical protein